MASAATTTTATESGGGERKGKQRLGARSSGCGDGDGGSGSAAALAGTGPGSSECCEWEGLQEAMGRKGARERKPVCTDVTHSSLDSCISRIAAHLLLRSSQLAPSPLQSLQPQPSPQPSPQPQPSHLAMDPEANAKSPMLADPTGVQTTVRLSAADRTLPQRVSERAYQTSGSVCLCACVSVAD